MLIPFLLVLFGAPTKNPADCAVLNAGLKMACEREIRAGRSFEIPPAPSDAATWSQEVPPPDLPQAPAPARQATPEERSAAAAERTASATETIATVQVISLSLCIILGIIVFVRTL